MRARARAREKERAQRQQQSSLSTFIYSSSELLMRPGVLSRRGTARRVAGHGRHPYPPPSFTLPPPVLLVLFFDSATVPRTRTHVRDGVRTSPRAGRTRASLFYPPSSRVAACPTGRGKFARAAAATWKVSYRDFVACNLPLLGPNFPPMYSNECTTAERAPSVGAYRRSLLSRGWISDTGGERYAEINFSLAAGEPRIRDERRAKFASPV